jgi:photosystem II stability/assembly factor-like uncharacterized protein
MRTFKISLLVFILSITLSAQWYDKSAGLPEFYGYAWAIDAYDSLIATGPFTKSDVYLGKPDSLYLTTDGGNSWFTKALPGNLEANDDLFDISIIGKDKIWFGTGLGKIYNTTDGGLSWQLQYYDTLKSKFINYIEMFDSLNGMAMGDPADSTIPTSFLKTTNGGVNWISQNQTELIGKWSGDLWRRVDFVSINIGYFYTFQAFPPTIYKTTNSGKNWTVFNDTIRCNVIKAYDENIFIAEYDNIVSRTIDAGQSWESNQFDSLFWGNDIEFIPDNPAKVWYSSYQLNVFFSSDTGKSWGKEFELTNLRPNDIVFTDENNGWLLANQPAISAKTRIFRTTNGGHGGIVISVDDNDPGINPTGFKLEQNYPNPFNPTTNIRFLIADRGFVTLKVYDVLGNEVATLVNEEKPAGEYKVEFDGNHLPSGIYFYQLKAGGFVETRKMILLK